MRKVRRYFSDRSGNVCRWSFVQGRTAHVSRCFDGINAVGVLGRMFEKTELSAEFAETFDREVCMPPTWLNFRDRKREYDVSVLARAAGYLNVLEL